MKNGSNNWGTIIQEKIDEKILCWNLLQEKLRREIKCFKVCQNVGNKPEKIAWQQIEKKEG